MTVYNFATVFNVLLSKEYQSQVSERQITTDLCIFPHFLPESVELNQVGLYSAVALFLQLNRAVGISWANSEVHLILSFMYLFVLSSLYWGLRTRVWDNLGKTVLHIKQKVLMRSDIKMSFSTKTNMTVQAVLNQLAKIINFPRQTFVNFFL